LSYYYGARGIDRHAGFTTPFTTATEQHRRPIRATLPVIMLQIVRFTTWRACPARSASSLRCGCSGISANLFADASEKLVGTRRARAARSYPPYLRKAPLPVRLTLLGVALEAALGNRRFAGGSADPADPEGRYSAGQRV